VGVPQKEGFKCESRRGVNEMHIYEGRWQEFEFFYLSIKK
jgi:hypothetical protein